MNDDHPTIEAAVQAAGPGAGARVAGAALAVLFALAALVQLNDPDPVHWVVFYLLAVAPGALLAAGREPPPALLGLAVIVAVGTTAMLSPAFPDTSLAAFRSVGMSSLEEELVRELWGALICAVANGALAVRAVRNRRPRSGATPSSA